MQAPGPLPAHEHDKASRWGSCSICYAWCLVALAYVMANPRAGVVRPRYFDRITRTWREQPGPGSDPTRQGSA